MEKLEKKINNWLNAATGSTILLVVLGAIFVAWPGLIVDIFRTALGVILIAVGVGLIAFDLSKRSNLSAFGGSVVGVVSLVLGILVFATPSILYIIPKIVGVILLLVGCFKLRLTLGMKNANTNVLIVSIVTNVITFLSGLILLLWTGEALEAAIAILGVILIVEGISSFVDVMVLRNNVKDFKRAFTKVNKRAADAINAVEAEIVVDDTKKGKKSEKSDKKSDKKSKKD